MNAERLLAHYDKIAEAPNAIGRLRRFILDLAVRGKLVKQDSIDEPAEELLKQIYKEKSKFSKTNKLNINSYNPASGNTHHPFYLPSSWTWSCLGDVAQYGSSAKVNSNKDISANTWILDLEDIEKDSSRLLERVIAAERNFNSVKTVFQKGDVLFGKLRPYLNKTIVADMNGVCTSEIIPIRGYCGLNPEYVRLVMKSPLTMQRVDQLMYGMKMPRLGTGDAIKLDFPLPPIAEQHRIVAKVDELMALCDQLKAARAEREATRDRLTASSLVRLNTPDQDNFQSGVRFALDALPALTTRPDQIKQLRQTILNLAVRGMLVPQDPKDEPAAELLKLIAKVKARLVKAGEIKSFEPSMEINQDDFPLVPPVGWILTRLATISRRIHYGYTASADAALKDVRMLRITDIQDNTVDWKTVPGCAIDPQSVDQYKLAKGDILIARTGGTIGKTFLVGEVPVTAVFASYLIRVQGTPNVYDLFLKLFLESSLYWTQLYDGARGTGQPNVNGQTLGKLILPLPPLAEQHRIVAKVDELMALCDQLESNLTTATNIRSDLLEALLAEAIAPEEAPGASKQIDLHTS